MLKKTEARLGLTSMDMENIEDTQKLVKKTAIEVKIKITFHEY